MANAAAAAASAALEKIARGKWAENNDMAAAEVDFVQSTSANVEVEIGVKPEPEPESVIHPTAQTSVDVVHCDAAKIEVSVIYFIHWVSNFERR